MVEITMSIRQPDSMTVKCETRRGKQMACCLEYRSDAVDVNVVVATFKTKRHHSFCGLVAQRAPSCCTTNWRTRSRSSLPTRGSAKERILDVGCGASSSNEAALAAKLGTYSGIISVDISAALAMAKGEYENAVIGNLDDPLALDTLLEHVGATGASSFAFVLDASPLNVGMVEVVRWKGIGRASKMVMLDFAFPLETRVALWTSRTAITGGRCKKYGRVLSCRASLISMRCWILPKDALQVSIARIPMNNGDNIFFANTSADPFVSTLADNVMRYVSNLR